MCDETNIEHGKRFKVCVEIGCGNPASTVIDVDGDFLYYCDHHTKKETKDD